MVYKVAGQATAVFFAEMTENAQLAGSYLGHCGAHGQNFALSLTRFACIPQIVRKMAVAPPLGSEVCAVRYLLRLRSMDSF